MCVFALQVKVLYVRNLTAMVSEDKIRETFLEHGNVERVKKIKDYAFVHFEERDQVNIRLSLADLWQHLLLIG